MSLKRLQMPDGKTIHVKPVIELQDGTGYNWTAALADDGEGVQLGLSINLGGGTGAPATAPYVTTAADATLTNEQVLGTAIIVAGTNAGRPAAGVAGRLYYATDLGTLSRDDGAAWAKVAVRDYTQLDSLPSTFAPSAHKNAHKTGGGDAFVAGDLLDATARIAVSKGGSLIGTRRGVNLIEGNKITLTVADNAGSERVDVTVAVAGLSYPQGTYTMSNYTPLRTLDFNTATLDNVINFLCTLAADGKLAGIYG